MLLNKDIFPKRERYLRMLAFNKKLMKNTCYSNEITVIHTNRYASGIWLNI